MRRLFFPAFLLLFLCGCALNHPIHQRSGHENLENGTGSLIWDALDDKVWIIIWFDIGNEDTDPTAYIENGTCDATTGRVQWHKGQTAVDGRKFEVRAATDNNGNTGRVEINGGEFRVEDGRVFLVTTRGNKPQTVQIRCDLDRLQPTRENLDGLAKRQPEIKAFVESLKAPVK